MYADIEALVLSGQLFNAPSRSSSPTRSASPSSPLLDEEDKGWHDEDLVNQEPESNLPPGVPQQESIGMAPGRTGVKGVIRDRNEAESLERAKRSKEFSELRKQMEKSALTANSYLEEERGKGPNEKVDSLIQAERDKEKERWEKERLSKRDVFGGIRNAKFGHLREIGVNGFVGAVENEEKGVWVVVHLYDSSLDRCFLLDDTLTHLARLYPDAKFLRCRAAALGFASTSKTSRSQVNRASRPSRPSEDSDDEFSEKHDSEEDNEEEEEVDLDMLPTLLVYRSGELVHNWVRVDWEAGEVGVEEFLEKHNILPRKESFFTSLGVHSSDEDDKEDLVWEDSDDET